MRRVFFVECVCRVCITINSTNNQYVILLAVFKKEENKFYIFIN